MLDVMYSAGFFNGKKCWTGPHDMLGLLDE
jgi:hypothetical protein